MSDFEQIIQIFQELKVTPAILDDIWNYKESNLIWNSERIDNYILSLRRSMRDEKSISDIIKIVHFENEEKLNNLQKYKKLDEWKITRISENRYGNYLDRFETIFSFIRKQTRRNKGIETLIGIRGIYSSEEGIEYDDLHFYNMKKVKIQKFKYDVVESIKS